MEAMIEQEVMTEKIPRTAMEVFELLPTGTLCEVINNTLYISPAPNLWHQKMSRLLLKAFERKLEQDGLSGEPFQAPTDVFLNGENAYQPDLIYVSQSRLHILNWEKGIMGAPDLVIEILSKGNTKQQMKDKKAIYESTAYKSFGL